MKTSQRVMRSLNAHANEHIVSVVGGPIKPGARVTVNGRPGTFVMFYRDSRKLKVELDEPLGTLRLCHAHEVQIAD